MAETAFLGLRGTGNWVNEQRPKNWRDGILRIAPNGDAPLTAMLARLKSQSTDDPEYNWWTKKLPEQFGTVTSVYSNAELSTELTSGAVTAKDVVVYVKLAEADAKHFKVGHTAVCQVIDDPSADVVGMVTAVVKNDASSYIAVKLSEIDDNSSRTPIKDLSDCNHITIIGSAHAEGAERPTALTYDPTKFYNFTQIFRNSIDQTRTARKTRLRTGDAWKEAKREALLLHSTEMEKAFLFGIRTEGTGDNGKPIRTTQGMVSFIRSNISANVSDFLNVGTLNGQSFVGKEWMDEDGGLLWMNTILEQIFRFGRDEKMAFVGSGTMFHIDRLAQKFGQINLSVGQASYGIRIRTWEHSAGTLHMKRHPLLSYNPAFRKSMIIFEPENITERPLDNTMYLEQKSKTGDGGRDATEAEFLTETGLEFHFPDTFGFLTGFGSDNAS